MGSLYEVEYLLLLSFELNYIGSEEYNKNNRRAVELIKMLSSYIKYLKTNEPNNLKS